MPRSRIAKFLPRGVPRLLPLLLLAACASGPRTGGPAWVGVEAVLGTADLQGHRGSSAWRNLDAARLAEAGIGDADIAAGRLLLVACSPSVDALWRSFAIAPPGVQARPGDVLRLQVQQDSGNERLGLNRVMGGVEPGLRDRLPAHRFIPDWRERGLANNIERIPLPPGLAGRYRFVQGSQVIAC